MKNYAKVGKRPGRPAYRSAASFRMKRNAVRLKCKDRSADRQTKKKNFAI